MSLNILHTWPKVTQRWLQWMKVQNARGGKNPQGAKGGELRIGVKSSFKKHNQPVIKHKEQIGNELIPKVNSTGGMENKNVTKPYDESLHLLKFHELRNNHMNVPMIPVHMDEDAIKFVNGYKQKMVKGGAANTLVNGNDENNGLLKGMYVIFISYL